MYSTAQKDGHNTRKLHDVGFNIISQNNQTANFGEKTTYFPPNSSRVPLANTTTQRPLSNTYRTNAPVASYPFPSTSGDLHRDGVGSIHPNSVVRSAHAALQGKRPTMEDEYVIAENVEVYTGLLPCKSMEDQFKVPSECTYPPTANDNSNTAPVSSQISIYAVMDGHGGSEAAIFTRKHLVNCIVTELQRGFLPNSNKRTNAASSNTKSSANTNTHNNNTVNGVYLSNCEDPHPNIESALRHAILRLDEGFLLRCIHEQAHRKALTVNLNNSNMQHTMNDISSFALTSRYNSIPTNVYTSNTNTYTNSHTHNDSSQKANDANGSNGTRKANGRIINGVYVPGYSPAFSSIQTTWSPEDHGSSNASSPLYYGNTMYGIPEFSCEKLRQYFTHLTRQIYDTDGATLCLLVLHPLSGSVWTCNVGDTRSILLKRTTTSQLGAFKTPSSAHTSDTSSSSSSSSSSGNAYSSSTLVSRLFDKNNINGVALTSDHKATTPSEVRRIEENGGMVAFGRVNGELAVARAIGDASFKVPCSGEIRTQLQDVFRFNGHHSMMMTGGYSRPGDAFHSNNDTSHNNNNNANPGKNHITFESGYSTRCPVTADPEISFVQLTADDVALVIACDGVWDVFSNQMVSDNISELLLKNMCQSNNISVANAGDATTPSSRHSGRNSSNANLLIQMNATQPQHHLPIANGGLSTGPAGTGAGKGGASVLLVAESYLRSLAPPATNLLESTAHTLAQRSISNGSMDNVSCIVIYVQHLTLLLEYMKRSAIQAINSAPGSTTSAQNTPYGDPKQHSYAQDSSTPSVSMLSLQTTKQSPYERNSNVHTPVLQTPTGSSRNDYTNTDSRYNTPSTMSQQHVNRSSTQNVAAKLILGNTMSGMGGGGGGGGSGVSNVPHPSMAPLPHHKNHTHLSHKYHSEVPVPFSPPPPERTRSVFNTGPVPLPKAMSRKGNDTHTNANTRKHIPKPDYHARTTRPHFGMTGINRHHTRNDNNHFFTSTNTAQSTHNHKQDNISLPGSKIRH